MSSRHVLNDSNKHLVGLTLTPRRRCNPNNSNTTPTPNPTPNQALLNDSSLWAGHRACHVVDVGAASYGPATGYDYSDSLLFLASLGRQCTIHAFDLSASKLLD